MQECIELEAREPPNALHVFRGRQHSPVNVNVSRARAPQRQREEERLGQGNCVYEQVWKARVGTAASHLKISLRTANHKIQGDPLTTSACGKSSLRHRRFYLLRLCFCRVLSAQALVTVYIHFHLGGCKQRAKPTVIPTDRPTEV